jgi:hypothetical protein
MKTTLLLADEVIPARLLLQNAASEKMPVREAEAVAGCTCDRWGHPCPNCVDRNGQTESGISAFIIRKEMR